MEFGSGLNAGRCNCPLSEHEKQFQIVSNLTKVHGQPHAQVRRRHSAGLQPSGAERLAPLRPALLQRERHPWAERRRPGPGHLPAGQRAVLQSLRQHQHRRPGDPVARVLLRPGHLARHLQADPELRPADRHHQPPGRERGGQRRLAGHRHRRDPRGRHGRHQPAGQRQEQGQLGAAPRRHVPDQHTRP